MYCREMYFVPYVEVTKGAKRVKYKRQLARIRKMASMYGRKFKLKLYET